MGSDARGEALRLDGERASLEAALVRARAYQAEQKQVLVQNNATMTSPLVDAQGFPDARLDLVAIRTARHRVHELLHDRDALTDKITSLLADALAEERAAGERATAKASTEVPPPRPVGLRSVAPQSPASHAGLQAGDIITTFGPLALTSATLARLPSEVHAGVAVRVSFRRTLLDGHTLEDTVVLTPSDAWEGRGLLG